MNPLGIRAEKLGAHIGSEQLARDMVAAKWIEPIVKKPKLTLYAASHVAKAFSRLLAGELPPQSNEPYNKKLREARRAKKGK